MRRGVVIAQDSGNRTFETYLASSLARLEAQHGDPLAALDYFLVAIRNLHDSGNSTTIRAILATLAALFDRLGHDEVAATMSRIRRHALHAVSRAGDQHRDNPPAQSSRRRNLRILSSQRARQMTTAAMVDLRTRPNRPGPSRTERRLEIDDIQDTVLHKCREAGARVALSQKSVSKSRVSIVVTSLMAEANSFAGLTQPQIVLCGASPDAARRTRPIPKGRLPVGNDNFRHGAAEVPIPPTAEAAGPLGTSYGAPSHESAVARTNFCS